MCHLVEDATEAPDVARPALLDDRRLAPRGRIDVPFPRVFESLGAHVVHRAELRSGRVEGKRVVVLRASRRTRECVAEDEQKDYSSTHASYVQYADSRHHAKRH